MTKRVAQRNSVGVPERVKINGIDEAHLAESFVADDGASWRFFVRHDCSAQQARQPTECSLLTV